MSLKTSTLKPFRGCHMLLKTYLFHLKGRNLSPRTIKATGEYLRPFLAVHDPLSASPRVIEGYLADLAERCQPSTVQTAWRHLKGFYTWLHREGDINESFTSAHFSHVALSAEQYFVEALGHFVPLVRVNVIDFRMFEFLILLALRLSVNSF